METGILLRYWSRIKAAMTVLQQMSRYKYYGYKKVYRDTCGSYLARIDTHTG